ncbi:MAG: carboxypeptidase regulatory-like domain-containing protein, partial [Terriglobia bacterium]
MKQARKKIGWVGMCVGFVLLAMAWPLRGQSARGTILGNVQDPSGAAMPGAKITLRNSGTNITNTFTTTSAGGFVFVNLIPGTYELTVSAPGFKTAGSKNLILQVDQTLRQNFTLSVGTLSQQVTVSAKGQMVQADNATIGQVITSHQLHALPISGRDFTNLLQINAGVTQALGGIQNSVFDLHGLNTQFSMVSVDGARPASISYIIDGFTDTDFFFTKPINVPPADAIQEFKLQNGLYSAQYGFGSAQVNVAIRSGTNQLHGLAYDFLENSAFQPTNPVQAYLKSLNPGGRFSLNPPFQQNQFGGQLGGPLVIPHVYNGRDRAFWFVSYEGGRLHQTGGLGGYQVPTTKEHQGDFSDWPYPIYNPATTGSVPAMPGNPSGRVAFPNNQLPSSMFNSIGTKLLSYFPTPNFSCAMPCSNFLGNVSTRTTTDVVTGRFDYNPSSRDQISFTANGGRDLAPGEGTSLLPASSQNVTNYAYLYGLRYQRAFSPNTVAAFHLGYTRENFHEGSVTAFGPNLSAKLGFNNLPNIPAFYSLPVVSFGDDYSGIGTSNNGYSQIDNLFQYSGNLTHVHGAHTINFGADVRRVQLWDVDGFVVNGSLGFTGAYTASDPIAGASGKPGPTAGNSFADLILGDPLRVGAPAPLGTDQYFVRGTQWGFYFQDDYHVTPHVTLNLGLRYEIPATFHSITNSGSIINLNNPPGGGLIWADKAFVQKYANPSVASTYFQCCVTNKLVPGRKNNFLPRIGFAWRPFTSNRFVVRGGFGMYSGVYMRFYDGTNYDENSLFPVQANPNYPVASGSETVSPLNLSTLWLPPQIISPFTSFPANWQFGVQTEWPPNKNPYDEQWSLDTQYALSQNLLLDVGYVGGRGLH